MWKKLLFALFASALALALATGLGAAIGALYMVLGGAILTSAGWSVIGTGGMLNIGLVAGAILLPLPILLAAYQMFQGRSSKEVASDSSYSLATTGAVYGLVGAAVLGMTAGIQLGYVSAAGAIGAVVGMVGGVLGLFVAASVLYILVYGLYQLAFQMTSPRENQNLILDKEHVQELPLIQNEETHQNSNNKKDTFYNQYNDLSKEVEKNIESISDDNKSTQDKMNQNSQSFYKKQQAFW